jgi:deoxyribodipyrimidine photo-lyase
MLGCASCAARAGPDGSYIRRYVAELRDIEGDMVHEPWRLPTGPPAGYPPPMVDHAEERAETLRRYAEAKGG